MFFLSLHWIALFQLLCTSSYIQAMTFYFCSIYANRNNSDSNQITSILLKPRIIAQIIISLIIPIYLQSTCIKYMYIRRSFQWFFRRKITKAKQSNQIILWLSERWMIYLKLLTSDANFLVVLNNWRMREPTVAGFVGLDEVFLAHNKIQMHSFANDTRCQGFSSIEYFITVSIAIFRCIKFYFFELILKQKSRTILKLVIVREMS